MSALQIQAEIDTITARLGSPEMHAIVEAGPYVDRTEYHTLHARLAQLDRLHALTAAQSERFYVTCINDSRTGWLLGPFLTHDEALAHVELARSVAESIDPFAHFYAFGTAKRTASSHPHGRLNDHKAFNADPILQATMDAAIVR